MQPATSNNDDKNHSASYIFVGLSSMMLAAATDALRGPLIPELVHTLGINYRVASYLLSTGYLASALCALFLQRYVDRLSDRFWAFAILLLGVTPLIGSFFVQGEWSLIIWGAVLGLGLSFYSPLGNIFVIRGTTLANRAKYLSALHFMYGIGAILAPFSITFALHYLGSWHFSLLLPTFLAILVFTLLLVTSKSRISPHKTQVLSRFSRENLRPVILIMILFVFYVTAEVMTSAWINSYLLEVDQLDRITARTYTAGFFVFLTLSRLLCFLFIKPGSEITIIMISLVAAFASYLLGMSISGIFFMAVGLCGPFFPLMMSIIPRYVGQGWQRVIVWIFFVVYVVLFTMSILMGEAISTFGIHRAFLIQGVCFIGAFMTLLLFLATCRPIQTESTKPLK